MTARLGWRPSPKDARDWEPARLRAMVKAGVAAPVSWLVPHILDQGQTNHCCGFAFATYCSAQSSVAAADPTITNALGHLIYYKAKEIEGIPPGHPDYEQGTNLRAGAKACQQLGLILNYAICDYWAAEDWCSDKSAVVCGLPWWSDMFNPKGGVLIIGGSYEGGHAIAWAKNRQKMPANNGHPNTWGRGFGLDGWCYTSDQTLYELGKDGEFCIAVRPVRPQINKSLVERLKKIRSPFFGGGKYDRA